MIVYAHRGANTELPENTLEAFRLALDLGVDALETDVHLTRDGEVVVHHDPTGLGTASTRAAIADSTLEDVRRWNLGFGFRNPDGTGLVNATYRVPKLSELLEAFPGVRLNIDVKPAHAEAARAVVAEGRRHRAPRARPVSPAARRSASWPRPPGRRAGRSRTGCGRRSRCGSGASPSRARRSSAGCKAWGTPSTFGSSTTTTTRSSRGRSGPTE